MDEQTWIIVWVLIAVLFAVVEIATFAFVAIYFSIGALAAAVAAALGFDVVGQLVAFSIAGIVLLFLTRPVLKRRLESPDVSMNVDRMAGKTGIVTIPIDNDANTGQIRVGTEYWTARTADGAPSERIDSDERVRIVAVEGVTARVERASAGVSAGQAAGPSGEA